MKKILILLFTVVSFWASSQTMPNYWVPTSGTDTYTTGIPNFGASNSNRIAFVKFGNTNTGAATIEINSLGAKALKKWNGSTWVDLASGDLKTTVVYKLAYDGTNFNVTGANLGDGGGSLTFSNGLTESGGAVSLGGLLSVDTEITATDNNFNLEFEDSDISGDTIVLKMTTAGVALSEVRVSSLYSGILSQGVGVQSGVIANVDGSLDLSGSGLIIGIDSDYGTAGQSLVPIGGNQTDWGYPNANGLQSATTTVNVSSATAPSSGQVLTATGSTAATWQTPTTGFTSGLNTFTANTTFDGNGTYGLSIIGLTYGVIESENQIGVYPDSSFAVGNIVDWPVENRSDRTFLGSIDVDGSSELFVQSESGAVVNLSGLPTPVTESGTSFTLNETHRGAFVYCTNGSAVTVTVPTGLPVGYSCTIVQLGAGTVSLSASGTTIVGATSTSAQYKPLPVHQYSTNNFIGY